MVTGVTECDESSREERSTTTGSVSNLQSIDLVDDKLSVKPRPLNFDPDEHKVQSNNYNLQ